MKRKQRKAFTIVELVIVIAVIGVLTAVLIPTFVNLTNKAQLAENQTFVKNINTQLAINEAEEGKNKTAHEAIMDAFDMGFDVRKLTPVNGNDIIWDEENDRFAIVAGNFAENKSKDSVIYADAGFKTDSAVKLHKLWKLYDSFDPANQSYSIYAKGNNWSGKVGDETNPLKVGFDAGENAGITSVYYAPGSTNSNEAVIRTKGGELIVDAESGSVKHYEIADIITIHNVAPSSYHEHGTTGSLTIESGRVVVEPGAYIAQATVANSAILEAKSEGKVAYVAASETATVEGTTITTKQKQVEYTQIGDTNKYSYLEDNVQKEALFVKSGEELNAALNGTSDLSGVSKVVVANDFVIEHPTSADNVHVLVDTTLDLNGHIITCNNGFNSGASSNGFFYVQSCDFRIIDMKGNGKIVYNNTYACNVDLFRVGQSTMTKDTSLILDSGILEFNSSNSSAGTYCIDVMDNYASHTAKFIMNGGSILCNDSTGGNNAEAIRLYDNGPSQNLNRNCYVEINNGYITGDIYFQMGLTSAAHKGEDTLVINGGTLIAKRPIRSTQYTATSTAHWGYAVVTLNGGNIITTEGFGSNYISYKNIIGTSYGDTSSSAWSDLSSWTAEKIFNITDNR